MSEVCFNTKLLREQGKKWTLANDVQLLNQLETFSQRLVSKSCSLLYDIDGLGTDLQRTKLDIKTLSNNFEAVSNTQFIENRVYDEDEDISSFIQRKNHSTSSSLNSKDKAEDAIKRCMNILESKFEAVNIPLSDSEDDNDDGIKSEVIFIPKNKYKSRPLPHLIGSEDFYNDESLGLALNHHGNENMSKSTVNEEDQSEIHSPSSSSNEPDESSIGLESHTSNYSDNEVNNLTITKDDTDFSLNSKETLQIINSPNIYSEEKAEVIHPQYSDKTENNSAPGIPSIVQNNSLIGAGLKSSIHDELKLLFKVDNNGEILAKPKLKTPVTSERPVHKSEKSVDIPEKSVNKPEKIVNIPEKTVDKPINIVDIPEKTINKSERIVNIPERTADKFAKIVDVPESINHNNEDRNNKVNKDNNKIKNNSENKYIKDNKSDILANSKPDHRILLVNDSMLPNIQTEILHSFAKGRAKIKGKRRLPSRKPRSIENDSGELFINNSRKEVPVLSPSTDEEDLFVLPKVSMEPSASSLFMSSSLFSPGSCIEENTNNLFPSAISTTNEMGSNMFFDEPLGVNRDNLYSSKEEEKMKNQFSDWDPFASEESVLFPSTEKRNRTTKLFDSLVEGSDVSLKINDGDDDDDIFSKQPAVNSLSLFDSGSPFFSSSSRMSSSQGRNKKDLSQLFSDGSDDSDDGSIFSKGDSFGHPFSDSLDRRKDIPRPTNAHGASQTVEAVRRTAYTNPLSDDLFD